MRRYIACFALIITASAGYADPVCFENGTDASMFLAIETTAGREIGNRDPGQTICVEGPGPVTVSAFESEEEFEGCSRRVDGTTTATIVEYQSVDLCIWRD